MWCCKVVPLSTHLLQDSIGQWHFYGFKLRGSTNRKTIYLCLNLSQRKLHNLFWTKCRAAVSCIKTVKYNKCDGLCFHFLNSIVQMDQQLYEHCSNGLERWRYSFQKNYKEQFLQLLKLQLSIKPWLLQHLKEWYVKILNFSLNKSKSLQDFCYFQILSVSSQLSVCYSGYSVYIIFF